MVLMKRIRDFWTLKNTFGYSFAIKCYFLRLRSFTKYEQFIFNFLEDEFSSLIEKYKEISDKKLNVEGSKYIWTLWWQGIDRAPEIVKVCLKSQQKNMVSAGFEYIIITKDNWDQYINLPRHILEKVENKKITLTHFSDIIRSELIRNYGGIWIDATVYCNKKIHLDPVSSLYTARSSFKTRSLTLGRWSGFLIGDRRESKLFSFMSDAFVQYWKKYDSLVTYLLIDFIIAIACKHFPEILEQYENIPVNQLGMWEMLRVMNQKYDEDVWNNAVQTADFWKLSYKDEFNGGTLRKWSKENQLTYWGYIERLSIK